MTLGMMATDVEQRIDFAGLREYRLNRAKAQLEQHDLGALLCFDQDNIRYITGTYLAEWARGKGVRWCLLPRGGEPILWEMSTAASVKRELCPWLPPENIRVSTPWWRGANDPRITDEQVSTAVSELRQVLVEHGVADLPLGVDEADGSIFTALQQQGLTVVSGYDTIFDARLVKSDDELKLIDMSASLVDGVYGHLVDFIKPGIRENEVVAEIYQWLIGHGVDHISGVNCVSGPRSNPHPHDYSDRMIRPGELVFIDIMSHYLGYATCYYRTFAVTKATRRQRDVYKRANEWLEASIDVVRPGITTADIASQWPSAKDLGYPSERAAMGLAIGHGIGLSHHEKPFINRLYSLGNPSPIDKNMHFALETFCGDGDDGARIESQVIVTGDGHRVITQWPSSELLVLAEH
jgi:Xaa-Pro dipeptidase